MVRMDTQNLKAFLAVAETRSFSAAANTLHITQPAISKRIHLLEQQLGVLLFDRINRQVSLTEAGKTLLPHAYAILGEMTSARQALADLSGEVKGQLKLIASHHVGLHRLPVVLREYAERYPQVDLNIRFMDSAEAYSAVQKGTAELGIITEVAEPNEAICSRTVWRDEMLFVVAPQHPLNKLNEVTLAEICLYPALLPERRFYTTKLVEELFIRAGLTLRINLSTNYLETIKALISAGYAWGVLPRSMLQDGTLAILPVVTLDTGGEITLFRNLDCIFHQQRLMSNAGRALLLLLQEMTSADYSN
jgi:DNA-binding transcriptional LysR family regulator